MSAVRNYSIDTLKAICAMLVVFIHCNYFYKSAILPIADVAVPLFFCISGYFVYASGRSAKRIKRIVHIFLLALLLYVAKTEAFHLISYHKLYVPTFASLINLVIFNDVSVSIHLWYLPAYLYVLIIAFFIDKFRLWKISFYFIIPLLVVGVIIRNGIQNVCPEQIQYHRNAYFVGLPYFLTGAFLNTPPCNSLKDSGLLRVFLPLLIILLALRYFIIGTSFTMMLLGTLDLALVSALIMILTISWKQPDENFLSLIGRKYSLYIYVFHMLFVSSLEMLAGHLPPTAREAYLCINPFVVYFLSIVLTYALQKIGVVKY